MPAGLIGKKVGMTRVFTESGEQLPVTVIRVGPCTVLGKRTQEKDQYTAIRVGFGEVKEQRLNKPVLGQFKKIGQAPTRVIREFRVAAEELGGFEVGQTLKADLFTKGQMVDVTGTSRGRGFAGVVKRHHMAGGFESHGGHEHFRHVGSIGQRKTPGRVFKNKRMPGHMGVERVTVQNLQVVEVDAANDIVLVKGAVPGHPNGLVLLRPAVKQAIRDARKK